MGIVVPVASVVPVSVAVGSVVPVAVGSVVLVAVVDPEALIESEPLVCSPVVGVVGDEVEVVGPVVPVVVPVPLSVFEPVLLPESGLQPARSAVRSAPLVSAASGDEGRRKVRPSEVMWPG